MKYKTRINPTTNFIKSTWKIHLGSYWYRLFKLSNNCLQVKCDSGITFRSHEAMRVCLAAENSKFICSVSCGIVFYIIETGQTMVKNEQKASQENTKWPEGGLDAFV